MSSANFVFKNNQSVSALFIERGATDFSQACDFIRALPYRRNSSKNDPSIIFRENCGTCSTKHAALFLLAQENEIPGIQLMLGIYRMNRQNTPGIGDTLEKNGIEFLPEAHNYLRVNGEILDCTGLNSSTASFSEELMQEIAITPAQIGDFKVNFHQSFIREWLQHTNYEFTFEQTWQIREDCIRALANNNN